MSPGASGRSPWKRRGAPSGRHELQKRQRAPVSRGDVARHDEAQESVDAARLGSVKLKYSHSAQRSRSGCVRARQVEAIHVVVERIHRRIDPHAVGVRIVPSDRRTAGVVSGPRDGALEARDDAGRQHAPRCRADAGSAHVDELAVHRRTRGGERRRPHLRRATRAPVLRCSHARIARPRQHLPEDEARVVDGEEHPGRAADLHHLDVDALGAAPRDRRRPPDPCRALVRITASPIDKSTIMTPTEMPKPKSRSAVRRGRSVSVRRARRAITSDPPRCGRRACATAARARAASSGLCVTSTIAVPSACSAFEQGRDLFAGRFVQFTGRLVGEQQPGPVRPAHGRWRRAAVRRRTADPACGAARRRGRRSPALRARARSRSARAAPASSSGSEMFSAAVSIGSRKKRWNTKPKRRSRSAVRSASAQRARIPPEERQRAAGRHVDGTQQVQQASTCRSPDGPMIDTKSPRVQVERRRRAARAPTPPSRRSPWSGRPTPLLRSSARAHRRHPITS